MIYKYIPYVHDLKLEKDQCTQVPLVGKKNNRIIIDCDNIPVTGIVTSGNQINYIEDGKFHNLNGPAKIEFKGNGKFEFEFHYKGEFTTCKTQEEFNKYIKKKVFE